MRSRLRILLVCGAVGLFGRVALSEEEPARRPEATEATVEKIMDQAVRNIATRYNLNEAQKQKTDELLKGEVRKFLKEHEKEIWPLIRDLLAAQLSGKPPENKEDVMRIGKAARPLAELAEKAIFDSNARWREILTADQKKVHDYDLAEMRGTFEKIHQNFESWEKGAPTDSPLIPPAQASKRQPPRPKQPPPGLPDPVIQQMELGVFEAIVDRYIKEYELDPAQIDTARSILAEYKTKGSDFQQAHRQQLTEIQARRDEAEKNRDREALRAAEADRAKVLEPFHGLVAEMDERVKNLLTSAQIEAHDRREQSSASKTPTVGKRPTPALPTGQAASAQPAPGEVVGPPSSTGNGAENPPADSAKP